MDVDSPNLFRHANLRLLALLPRKSFLDDEVPFLCECDDPSCFGTVHLSVDEFERVCFEGGSVTLRGHPIASPRHHGGLSA